MAVLTWNELVVPACRNEPKYKATALKPSALTHDVLCLDNQGKLHANM
jgi:hypothetical protein